MYKRAIYCLAVMICVACAFPSPSPAQGRYSEEPYGPQILPLDRILPGIRNGRAGRFYDAEGPFPEADGGYHYRIKWLTPEGRVVWLDTDARSGRVIGTARSDWREQGPEPVGPRFEGEPTHGAYGMPEGQGSRGGRGLPFAGPRSGPARGNFRNNWHGNGRGHRG
jgi:hypothetical protein